MDSKKSEEAKKYARKENIFNIIGGLMNGIGVALFFSSFVVAVLTEKVGTGILLAYIGFGLNILSPVFYMVARYYKNRKIALSQKSCGIDGLDSSSPSSIDGDYLTEDEARKDHLYHWNSQDKEEETSYCPYCGAKNPKDALYCCRCGKRIHKDE